MRTLRFQQQALSATATILACDFPQGDQVCFPLVRFTTMASHTITVQITSSGSSTYHRGDTLPIQYHLATPEDARLADTISLSGPFYLFIGFFFVCLFLSRYLFWRASELERPDGA